MKQNNIENSDKKLVGYITASIPDNNFTVDLALSMKEAGVDTLELGIPFSDPVAEGPIIEKANLLALKNGFKINDLFEVSSKIAKDIENELKYPGEIKVTVIRETRIVEYAK